MTYVRQHHFHKQKIYLGLPRIFSIDPASISVKKGLFSSKQHRSTRRNNSLHPGYLTLLVTRTNHNTIQTIGIYVRVFRTADHAGQIFIPHRRQTGRAKPAAPKRHVSLSMQFFRGLPFLFLASGTQCNTWLALLPMRHTCPSHLNLLFLMMFSISSCPVLSLILMFVILSRHNT